jgi:hypothetical protein
VSRRLVNRSPGVLVTYNCPESFAIRSAAHHSPSGKKTVPL